MNNLAAMAGKLNLYYVEVQGRIRNDSDESLKSNDVSIIYEDARGQLVATGRAYVSPRILPPGAIGTFSGMDQVKPDVDHVKLDFTGNSGTLIRWTDRSGKHAHQ
jgi:hypothetical protein